jgi:hypothetical protein
MQLTKHEINLFVWQPWEVPGTYHLRGQFFFNNLHCWCTLNDHIVPCVVWSVKYVTGSHQCLGSQAALWVHVRLASSSRKYNHELQRIYVNICIIVQQFLINLCLVKHHAIKAHEGVEVQLDPFLTSALDGDEWSADYYVNICFIYSNCSSICA